MREKTKARRRKIEKGGKRKKRKNVQVKAAQRVFPLNPYKRSRDNLKKKEKNKKSP